MKAMAAPIASQNETTPSVMATPTENLDRDDGQNARRDVEQQTAKRGQQKQQPDPGEPRRIEREVPAEYVDVGRYSVPAAARTDAAFRPEALYPEPGEQLGLVRLDRDLRVRRHDFEVDREEDGLWRITDPVVAGLVLDPQLHPGGSQRLVRRQVERDEGYRRADIRQKIDRLIRVLHAHGLHGRPLHPADFGSGGQTDCLDGRRDRDHRVELRWQDGPVGPRVESLVVVQHHGQRELVPRAHHGAGGQGPGGDRFLPLLSRLLRETCLAAWRRLYHIDAAGVNLRRRRLQRPFSRLAPGGGRSGQRCSAHGQRDEQSQPSSRPLSSHRSPVPSPPLLADPLP
jgi:hypothetical protein